ncbi:MAG: HAD family hydrolase [Micromonosporaceae bacterium]
MRGPVLFDVDGTVVDTPGANATLIAEVVAETGRPRPAEAAARALIGRSLDAIFSELLGLPVDHPEVGQAKTRFRQRFTDQVVPTATSLVFPGVVELLGELRRQERPLAVVTSKITVSATEMLRAAGLIDAFDTVVCHDMAPRGKPYPDLALLAAEHLGASPADCVMVGDALDDIRMAVAAGMAPVGVGYGVATSEQLFAAGAVAVAPSAAALSGILGGLSGPGNSGAETPVPPGASAGRPETIPSTAR